MFTYLDSAKWSKNFRHISESSLFSLNFETNVDTLGAVIQKWEILNLFLTVCCINIYSLISIRKNYYSQT